MKINGREVINTNVIALNNTCGKLYDICGKINAELNSLSYSEICTVQTILFDAYENTIQRLRSNNYELRLSSGGSTWNNEQDIFDILKNKKQIN